MYIYIYLYVYMGFRRVQMPDFRNCISFSESYLPTGDVEKENFDRGLRT